VSGNGSDPVNLVGGDGHSETRKGRGRGGRAKRAEKSEREAMSF
jgi:hypothetical protein